jgi:hypothetical protein
MLVFSKTSLQRDRISPRTPRAIYFNDDVYVGYCHAGEVIEVAAADGQLGAVFYTLDQTNEKAPTLVRQTHRCLQCHGSLPSRDIPGFGARSLFVDAGGQPLLSEGSHHVDHTTPLEKRWGGWYVTGTHGAQEHLGNLVVRDPEAPRPWKNTKGQNVTDLSGRFASDDYLAPSSDIVALMVFEHQAHVHNLITKAGFTARQALYYEAEFNRGMGKPENNRLESTTRRIASAGDDLVEALFFVGEAPLKAPIAGNCGYAELFAGRGARDARGRSVRDSDLSRRMFKYACSDLVYARTFDELPPIMLEYVGARVRDVLAGNGGPKFDHLSASDRQAIAEILRETKPSLTTE